MRRRKNWKTRCVQYQGLDIPGCRGMSRRWSMPNGRCGFLHGMNGQGGTSIDGITTGRVFHQIVCQMYQRHLRNNPHHNEKNELSSTTVYTILHRHPLNSLQPSSSPQHIIIICIKNFGYHRISTKTTIYIISDIYPIYAKYISFFFVFLFFFYKFSIL